MNQLRILFWGTLGTLSRLPLSALLSANLNVVGLVVPAGRVPPFLLPNHGRSTPMIPIRPAVPSLNLLSPESSAGPLEMAVRQQIPAFGVRNLKATATLAALRALSPDLICVSCFPHLLPPAILQLPRFGCLNVHPSLLPHFRGPAPLFWTFQRGVNQTGVTIHFMNEAFDTGDIALQRPFTLPDGISGPAAEEIMANIGADLLADAVQQVAMGTLSRRSQPDGFPADAWPQDSDFELHTSWSARHAFNFMRGTADWQRPYFVTIGDRKIGLRHAIAYQPQQKPGQPIVTGSDHLAIRFADGVLLATKSTSSTQRISSYRKTMGK